MIKDTKKRSRMVLLVIASISLFIVCLCVPPIFSTLRVFFLLEKIHPPKGITSVENDVMDSETAKEFLNELKEIARYILSQPKKNQEFIVKSYNFYTNFVPHSHDYLYRVLKLSLLQRLLFKVPDHYPQKDAVVFVYWDWGFKAFSGDEYNLLWPLSYDLNGTLVFSSTPGSFHDYYNGAQEYDYFFERFPLREIEELK